MTTRMSTGQSHTFYVSIKGSPVSCVNRFLGRCPTCTHDLDPSHHPNNLECPKFTPMHTMGFIS